MTSPMRGRAQDMEPVGDPVPAILARYYQAIDGDRFSEAAGAFAPDGRCAVPAAGVIETAPRAETVGPAALRARFAERGPSPWRHVVQLCVVAGSQALIEGVLVDEGGAATATFVASARIDIDGRIGRYLAFSCPGAREAFPTDVPVEVQPADAAQVVHDYFRALDGGRFPEAAAHFSDDVLYSHPPYLHTGIDDPDRVELRGRRALEAAFGRRGATSFGHEVLTSVQRGPHCLLEGAVDGLPDGGTGSFISSLSLDRDGRIRRYVSFYCEPAVSSAP
ncbi:MAG: nuclear transport factor 2 family protein [Acidimicrobiales bacterium]